MRLIDATKAIESIDEIAFSMSVCISTDYCHGMTAMKDAAIHAVERQPTVDAVHVVRCRDCKWCEYPAHNSTKYGCKLFDRCVKGDWFCADGKRKDGK